MKKTIIACGVLLSIAVITPAYAVLHIVNASGFSFGPNSLQIEIGDQVQWVRINGSHTTTSGPPGIPDGLWNVSLNSSNTSFTRTFSQIGMFPYYCIPHYAVYGMTGTIEVVMPTGIRDDQTEEAIPPSAVLYQNFPNPFNAATQIRYNLSDETHVCLTILDMLGHPVRTLINEQQAPGLHWSTWDGLTDYGDILASGMYLYRLRVDNAVESKKMIFLK